MDPIRDFAGIRSSLPFTALCRLAEMPSGPRTLPWSWCWKAIFSGFWDISGGGSTTKPSDSYSQKGLTLWRRGPSKFHKATDKGAEEMTKAKARQRAKAKAGQKARKREANADRSGQELPPRQFDPGESSIKGPRENAAAKNFAGARRGSARSR